MLLCLYNDADTADTAIARNIILSGFDIGITITFLTAAAISGALITLAVIASAVLNISRCLGIILRTIPNIRNRLSKMQAAQMRDWYIRYDANIAPNKKLPKFAVNFETSEDTVFDPERCYVIVYSHAENPSNATGQIGV